jgi:hypothetical protein
MGYFSLRINDLLALPAWDSTTGGTTTQLAAPTGLAATPLNNGSIGVSWNTVANSIGYTLQRALVSNGVTGTYANVYSDTATSYVDANATPGAVLRYRVKARGTGAYSDSGYASPVQVTVAQAGTAYRQGIAILGQSPASGLAPQRDRSGTQLGPFPALQMWDNDANAAAALVIGGPDGNEAGLNGGLTQMEPRSDGASIVGALVNYYDGFGPERRLGEVLEAAGAGPISCLKKNVEHPSSTNGSTLSTWQGILLAELTQEYNKMLPWHTANGLDLQITHLVWRQGEAERDENLWPNAPDNTNPNFVADTRQVLQSFRTLFNNPNLLIQLTGTRGANYQYAAVNAFQKQVALLEPNVVYYDDVAATYLSDGVHEDANTMDRVGAASQAFLTANPNTVLKPTITAFSPTQQQVGGVVVVYGTNWKEGTTARFGAISAQVQVISPTEVRVTVPSGAASGNVTLSTVNGSVTQPNFVVGAPNNAAVAGQMWNADKFWTFDPGWTRSDPDALGADGFLFFVTAPSIGAYCNISLIKPQRLAFFFPLTTGGDPIFRVDLVLGNGTVVPLGTASQNSPTGQPTNKNVANFITPVIPTGDHLVIVQSASASGTYVLLDTTALID